MKRFAFTLLAFMGLSLAIQAQTKPVLTATIKTPNALCQQCKERIESYLKRYDGLLETNVNFRIKTAIANCGYDADDVPAAEDAYDRLPKTCKKFEDGGGHPKPKAPPQQ
jgi:periplasmic mercuric ion binding protein